MFKKDTFSKNKKPRFELYKVILSNSENNTWTEATKEWENSNYEIDYSEKNTCVCGQPGLKHLFEIKNKLNNQILFPIGSDCIKYFEDENIIRDVEALLSLNKLREYYNEHKYIENFKVKEDDDNIFTRKLINYLFKKGVFKTDNFDTAEEKYNFCLKMFNLKRTATKKETNKSKAIIIKYIIPYINKVIIVKNENEQLF